MEQMTRGRVYWIDIAKGLCMILVVLGHTMRGGPVWHGVYGFHVAAFFFLSGMTCGKGGWAQIKKDLRRIMVPYYGFGLVSIGIFVALGQVAGAAYGIPVETAPLENLWNLLYASGRHRAMAFNTALWFLPCLFVTKVLYYGLVRACRENLGGMLALSLGLAALGCWYTGAELPFLPFSVTVAVKMLPLFVLGRICLPLAGRELPREKVLFLGLALLGLACVIAWGAPKVNYSDDLFPDLPAFCATAVLGTGGLSLLSMGVARNRMLEYLGRNTLAVMVMHKFPVMLFQIAGPFRDLLLENDTLPAHLWGMAVCLISIGLCLMAAGLIRRTVPALLGGT